MTSGSSARSAARPWRCWTTSNVATRTRRPSPAERNLARTLALRLLVVATDVHTPAGHHVTLYGSWRSWTAAHSVTTGDAVAARAAVESIVAAWPRSGRRRLLPW